METWRGRDMENRMRVLRNELQPASKPRYTALGFKKSRVPDDVYQIMWNRYKTGERVTEPWPKSDCHTNFFEVRACALLSCVAGRRDGNGGSQAHPLR